MAREPGHTGVRMQMRCSRDARAAIRRNQAHVHEMRCNQTQSGARTRDVLQSDAIRRTYTRCAAIRRNQAHVHEMCGCCGGCTMYSSSRR